MDIGFQMGWEAKKGNDPINDINWENYLDST